MYLICDFAHLPNWVEYVIEDSLTTAIPVAPEKRKGFFGIKAPQVFETKKEAQVYLDALKSSRLNDWEEHGDHYNSYGKKKPQWKIYPHDEVSQVIGGWG